MKANIVIMGQSGNGKSTIVNAIIGKNVAPTGKGAAVTMKNMVYSTSYNINKTLYTLNLYDTVGIELSDTVTKATLADIEKHIAESQKSSKDSDINIVWFCINNRSSRFQDFEVDLIRKLSFDYEIPFVIVMTQCFDDEVGELENSIRSKLPEIATTRILAKDYPRRGGKVIPAYGIDHLLRLSILEYNKLKVRVLQSKLNEIQKNLNVSNLYLDKHNKEAKLCIQRYVESTKIVGWIPVGCIPFIHNKCIAMTLELHQIYGVVSNEGLTESIISNIIDGIIATPLMAIPVLSMEAACRYISIVGEKYSSALLEVLKQSKYSDLEDQQLMSEQIRKKLNKRKER